MNSALQRARATLRERLPERRTEWAPSPEPSEEERELLRRYVDAHERADVDALAALLREDARLTMPPHPTWFEGRGGDRHRRRSRASSPTSASCGAWSTGANRQPAAAHYLRPPGETDYRAAGARRAADRGRARSPRSRRSSYPELFPAFGLPPALGDR